MKSVFITGGSTGIGLELAKLYVQAGWRVGVCGRSEEKFQDSLKEIDPHYKSAIKFYCVDVVERDKLKEAVAAFSEGKLDLVIANAGISMGDKKKIPNFDRARKVLNTNIFGVLNTFEAALEEMYPHSEGQLVAISSVAGFAGLPGTAAYSSSKSAVTTFCETLSIDLRKVGIHVTCICPGFIDTPLTKKNRHWMPFLMPASKGAMMIKSAIDRKRELYAFPLPMAIAIQIIYHVPRWFYRMVVRWLNFDLTGGKKK